MFYLRRGRRSEKGRWNISTERVRNFRQRGWNELFQMALEGDATGELIDLATKTPDCLIAMSTHGRSGIDRCFLGSVAEKVIQHSSVPVFIIRPE